MKKIIVINQNELVIHYILRNNNEYCSEYTGNINSLNKEEFVKLDLNNPKVIDLVNYFNRIFNIKCGADIKWVVDEFWLDKTLLNKNITIGMKHGIPINDCLKEEHVNK